MLHHTRRSVIAPRCEAQFACMFACVWVFVLVSKRLANITNYSVSIYIPGGKCVPHTHTHTSEARRLGMQMEQRNCLRLVTLALPVVVALVYPSCCCGCYTRLPIVAFRVLNTAVFRWAKALSMQRARIDLSD